MSSNELFHYGVPGMKWGRRKDRYKYSNGANPTSVRQRTARKLGGTTFAKRAITKSRYLDEAGKKQALKENHELADEKAYNKAANKAHKTGGTLVYDVTSKKYSVNKPIGTNKIKNYSADYKESREIKKKHPSEMSNAELKKLNERLNLERNYSQMNQSTIQKGTKFLSTAAVTTTTVLTLYNNSDRLINIGRKILNR